MNAFTESGSIEQYGSGFIRIRKALRDYPEIDFEIKEFAGGVMVTFAQREGVNYAFSICTALIRIMNKFDKCVHRCVTNISFDASILRI